MTPMLRSPKSQNAGHRYLRLFVGMAAVVVFLEAVVRPLASGPGWTAVGVVAALPVAWAVDRLLRRLLSE